MNIKKRKFGLLADGSKVFLYTVSNGGMSFSVTNYGCVITSIVLPSCDGRRDDVVLGPPTFDALVASGSYFGAVVGRFANRIGGSRFSLNGTDYLLDKNDGKNSLHGGFFRWDKQLWDAELVDIGSACGVRFSRLSPDGEQGMPGNMKVELTYLLNTSNELSIHYKAVSDKDTPVNFTNHSYFNLKGQGKSIEGHVLSMNCSSYLEVDETLIPTGRILPVDGTPFDFRKAKAIGKDLFDSALKGTNGYDHCYCVDNWQKGLVSFASVTEPESGRTMTVSTDLPGVQLYTANSVGGNLGKSGFVYSDHAGFCLETQYYPDTPNKPDFPSCVLRAGEEFSSTTVYGFKW